MGLSHNSFSNHGEPVCRQLVRRRRRQAKTNRDFEL